MRARSLSLYPFLLAAWPPLALAAKNAGAVYRWQQLAVPIAVGCAVAGLAWGVAAAGRVAKPRRPAVAAGAALGWWSYGALVALLRYSPVIRSLGLPHSSGWIVVAALLGIGYLVIRRLPAGFGGATMFLNLLGGLLVANAGGRLALAWWPVSPPHPRPAATVLGPAVERPGQLSPDVYLIILDAYTGARSLGRYHGFDNSAFLAALRDRGFVIPRSERANYPHTLLALASLLNWEPVETLVPDLPPGSQNLRLVVPLIEENPTWAYFSRRGYRIAFFPSVREITGRNRYATEGFADEADNFREALRNMTPLPGIQSAGGTLFGGARGRESLVTWKMLLADRQFRMLSELRRPGQPVLAFAHIMLPHEPYVYQADCSPRDPSLWPWIDLAVPDSTIYGAYLEQLTCLNRRVLELVDRLRPREGPDPVIILMGDHGLGVQHRGISTLAEASPETVDERLDAFAAVLVPPGARDAFRGDLTPIGVMRGVMREVFGLSLPNRQEPSYWSPDDRLYDLRPVVPPGATRPVAGTPR
ncbi:MAG TPA: hypothetical protein VGQ17_08515 [Gemmatimonadales bacterium]|jgi:hypothetical protein|nr:hypothetical protein [Gemmatimonadales bacterium]